MSRSVPLDDLSRTLAGYPWGFLITVGPDLKAHLLAVPTDLRDGSFHVVAGRTSRANASQRPEVTLAFPPAEPGAFSLIVDGSAVMHTDHLSVIPSRATLHRPALTDG